VKRALAVAGAVVMIALAVVIRRGIDDDGGSSSSTTTQGNGSGLVLACVTELQPVCDAVAAAHSDVSLRIEEAGTTSAALAAGKSDVDAWLTFVPWPDIANTVTASGAPVVTGTQTVVATTRLGIAIWRDRADALTSSGTCPDINWSCLGFQVGKEWTEVGGELSWGQVKVDLPPGDSGIGRLVDGDAARSFFLHLTPPVTDWALNDFGTAGFSSWYANITANGTVDPLGDMLSIGPAVAAAAGTTTAAFTGASGQRKDDLEMIYPPSPSRANVVIAGVNSGNDAGKLISYVTDSDAKAAFTAAHWDVNVDPVPPNNLPSGGVLYALGKL
jgi:hypothetical protein